MMYRFFVITFYLFLVSAPAYAQILGISAEAEAITLDTDFLLNLSECKPDVRLKNSAHKGVSAENVYSIKQLNDGECQFQVTAHSSNGLNITQDCHFTLAQAYDYANALYRLWQKGYDKRHRTALMFDDEDYQAAMKFFADDNICTVHRAAIDFTADFRSNLADCLGAENIEQRDAAKITRKITGRQNNLCLLSWQLDITEPYKLDLQYSCELPADMLARYASILQADTVPEEYGTDFSAIERQPSKLELEFINENCRLQTN